jgi:hypothetical protein
MFEAQQARLAEFQTPLRHYNPASRFREGFLNRNFHLD